MRCRTDHAAFTDPLSRVYILLAVCMELVEMCKKITHS